MPIIATGRPYSQIQSILENTIIDSYILVNGQTIIFEGKEIYKSVFEKDNIEEFHNLAKQYEIPLAFYGSNSHVISQLTPTVDNAMEYFNIPTPSEDSKYYEHSDVLMMLLFTENLKHDQIFKENYPTLNLYRTSPYSIDVIHSINSKAKSIDKLRDHMIADELVTYAFGDGINDLEMIKNATYGIAMDNGVQEVKEVANVVVSSNDEKGIVEGLKYYKLI